MAACMIANARESSITPGSTGSTRRARSFQTVTAFLARGAGSASQLRRSLAGNPVRSDDSGLLGSTDVAFDEQATAATHQRKRFMGTSRYWEELLQSPRPPRKCWKAQNRVV